MNLYIDNASALHFYCMVETSLDDVTKSCTKTMVSEAASSLSAINDFDLSNYDFGQGPLHVLVGSPASRSASSSVRFHVRTTELPLGAFRRLGSGIYIVSPELCFYEMARRLTFPKLVEFGFILCGTYTLNPAVKEDANCRVPLTTKRKLESFAFRMRDKRGSATVMKTLEFVLERSASPRETKLALLLTLPVRLGGYRFEPPIMNYQINFSETERKLFGRPYVVLDLYWPNSHCGVEYDGAESHSGKEDVSRDRKKNSELNYRGINVIRVDKQQLATPFQVYVLTRKLQRLMKIRHRKPTDAEWQRKEELFDTLMR